MATLLSSTEIAGITGIFGDIFDTFKRDVVIYKEPKKSYKVALILKIYSDTESHLMQLIILTFLNQELTPPR